MGLVHLYEAESNRVAELANLALDRVPKMSRLKVQTSASLLAHRLNKRRSSQVRMDMSQLGPGQASNLLPFDSNTSPPASLG